jgi:hemerythrin-like domain-containing protein
VDEGKQRLMAAVTLCRRHLDKEERIVFPMAEKQLSAKSLLLLGKRWEEQRTKPIGPLEAPAQPATSSRERVRA